MKSKCLIWALISCLMSVATVLGQNREVEKVDLGSQDNLSQDVILIPAHVPASKRQLRQSSEPFSINPTFDENVTREQRAVFQQAIDEWTAIIRTRGFTQSNYPITFSNGQLAGNTLARTTVAFNADNGDLVWASIVFDDRPTTTWYVDPTPASDSEFNSTPPAGFDLLSVARHEIGHAVGWGDTQRVTGLLNGNIFDAERLNIATVSTGGRHADPNVHANDIMVPAIGFSTRRSISLYPSAALVARANSYSITMRFVDGAYDGAENGSANQPWNTVKEGLDLTPLGNRLLLVPGTYDATGPLTLFRRMIITAARGGVAVIK